MTTSDLTGAMPDLGFELTHAPASLLRSRRQDPVTINELSTLAFRTRAAFVRQRFDEAAELGHKYESSLVRHLQQRLARCADTGRPMSARERDLVSDLLRRTRTMVVAATTRDVDQIGACEAVTALTILYCRGRRIQALLDGEGDPGAERSAGPRPAEPSAGIHRDPPGAPLARRSRETQLEP